MFGEPFKGLLYVNVAKHLDPINKKVLETCNKESEEVIEPLAHFFADHVNAPFHTKKVMVRASDPEEELNNKKKSEERLVLQAKDMLGHHVGDWMTLPPIR